MARTGRRRQRRVRDAVAAIDGHFMQLRTGQSSKFVADSQRGQKRNVAGANAGTADLAPRESAAFQPTPPTIRPRQARLPPCCRPAPPQRRSRRNRNSRTAARRTATNVCEKSRASTSLSRQPPSLGQHAESSRSRNPARTLRTASRRVTSLAPRAPTRWLPYSATRARRGSHAMKQSVIRAIPRNSRDSASPSKWCMNRLAITASYCA